MYVAIRRYKLDPEAYGELQEKLETGFLPDVQQIDGFSAYYAVKTGPDTLSTVSVFETQEGERESTKLAAEFVRTQFPDTRVQRLAVDEGTCFAEVTAVTV